MENGLKQEKSTGYSQSTLGKSASASPQPKSTENKRDLPVLTDAHSREESLNSTAEVSASKILAVQVMMGDFKELKNQLPESRQSSSNGKIYWSAEIPGHTLAVEKGKLLVDGKPVESFLQKLLASKENILAAE